LGEALGEPPNRATLAFTGDSGFLIASFAVVSLVASCVWCVCGWGGAGEGGKGCWRV
jgi:hypothetical protein